MKLNKIILMGIIFIIFIVIILYIFLRKKAASKKAADEAAKKAAAEAAAKKAADEAAKKAAEEAAKKAAAEAAAKKAAEEAAKKAAEEAAKKAAEEEAAKKAAEEAAKKAAEEAAKKAAEEAAKKAAEEVLFFDAKSGVIIDGNIKEWYDTTNKYSFIQENPDNRPKMVTDSVYFRYNDETRPAFLNPSSSIKNIGISKNITLFFVMKLASSSRHVKYQEFFASGTDYTVPAFNTEIGSLSLLFKNNNFSIGLNYDGPGKIRVIDTAFSQPYDTTFILVVNVSNAISFRYNKKTGTFADKTDLYTFTTNSIPLNPNFNLGVNSSNNFIGSFNEFIFYNKQLSLDEISKVEDSLITKWAVKI